MDSVILKQTFADGDVLVNKKVGITMIKEVMVLVFGNTLHNPISHVSF